MATAAGEVNRPEDIFEIPKKERRHAGGIDSLVCFLRDAASEITRNLKMPMSKRELGELKKHANQIFKARRRVDRAIKKALSRSKGSTEAFREILRRMVTRNASLNEALLLLADAASSNEVDGPPKPDGSPEVGQEVVEFPRDRSPL